MTRKLKTMDGNNAAAHVAYAFTEVAAIYPITPSSTMAEYVDKWAAGGRKNIFGQTVKVLEMQSEGGAAGAVHGSLITGALTSTFTASQGLLLMIPNMYKMAGEGLPAVLHVSARTVAAHALSIFGDHSDVMACRQTGFAMLASNSPQEAMDLGAVAHLSAIGGSMPFVHFFDGFRTSHEMQRVAYWENDDLADLIDRDALAAFRAKAQNPNHPILRGSAQNGDIYFQAREACNPRYAAIPDIVEKYMDAINERIGTDYKPFNYYGDPEAERVIIAMGSVCETGEEVVDYLRGKGEKVGIIKVRLYRPFSVKHLLAVMPKSVKSVAVLDRTKEPGGMGEPLYLDVFAALAGTGITVVGGRYGLASKDTTPGCVLAVFNNLKSDNPVNSFTIGITDDVTGLSLPITEEPDTCPSNIISCKFWGLGSDGTVGANKNSIKIIGDHADMNAQAYFQYDSKKSGGVTISHLRFGDSQIKSAYYVSSANFVACHNSSYIEKYNIARDVKPGGILLINCAWDAEELGRRFSGDAKRYIAENHILVYTVDAVTIAKNLGLGNKMNSILQAAFFKLSGILPIDDATRYMKEAIRDTYGRKGEAVVNMNNAAVDAGLANVVRVDIPDSWLTAEDEPVEKKQSAGALADYVDNIMNPINSMRGDDLPVSAFLDTDGGSFVPAGTAAFEKRGIAVDVPSWIPENCIQCNQCSLVCPHAVIRPFVMTDEELADAPEGTKSAKLAGKNPNGYNFSVLSSVLDCTGCLSCINVCPSRSKALVAKPLEEMLEEQKSFDYAEANIPEKKDVGFDKTTVKGSQFVKPLLEFSGACAGCGETPYAKLVTQLFGDRMYIANATGCSSIWGGSVPSTPYTVNKEGKGPAWSNSLFEDNAEFGLGMSTASVQRRAGVKTLAETALAQCTGPVTVALENWLAAFDNGAESAAAGAALEESIAALIADGTACDALKELYEFRDQFVKPSFWIFGGDGWAYDIGYGGLDHVLASGENVNVLVFDTEVYSNTGGQASKATPTGAVAQFAAAGKSVKKKDLAQIAISYGYIYVAQVAMGANYQQTLKALIEAESYNGPSLIIAYAPCINHGIRAGMGKSMTEAKRAVEAGYWNLLRFDPRLLEQGKNPLSIDCKEATSDYNEFIMGEVRYSSLPLSFPDRAAALFDAAQKDAAERYRKLVKQQKMYSE